MTERDPDRSKDASSERGRSAAQLTARTVPWIMGVLAAGVRERAEGIHLSQVKALMVMHGRAVSPSQLAEHMEVSLPTISKTIAVLERRGWIERRPQKEDRRRVLLAITDDGSAAMRKALDSGVEQLSDMLASANAAELENIQRGMESLQDVLARAYPEHARHHRRRPERGDDPNR